MGLRFGLIFLFSLLLQLAPSWVGAQSDDPRERARTLFQEGVSRFDAGDFSAALASFEAAHQIAPHPSVRINMANCLEQLGRYGEAIDNYQSFLNESSNLKPAQRAEIGKAIERLSRHFGTVDVRVSPAHAQLTVDGIAPNRTSGGALIVPTGEHVLRANLDGHESTQRIIQVEGGSNQTVELQLSALPAPEPVGAPPLVAEGSEPSQEPVRGYEPEPGEPETGSRRVWLWTAAGAAALLTVGFVTTAGLTFKAQNDLDENVERSRDLQQPLLVRQAAYADAADAKDKAERLALISDVMLGGAVAATGATLVLWLLDRRRDDRQTAGIDARPLLQRHAAGLALGGRF